VRTSVTRRVNGELSSLYGRVPVL